jgi:hypothetical protein
LPVAQGGRGFGVMGTTTLLVVLNLFGMFPGYISFGWLADCLGRRRAFMLYTFMAAVLVPVYADGAIARRSSRSGCHGGFLRDRILFGIGDHRQRKLPDAAAARALGFTYNGARTLSSVAPYVIRRVGQTRGPGWAFYLCGAGF